MTLEELQAQERGWGEAWCLETWGASGLRTEAKDTCLTLAARGQGHQRGLCLPCTEIPVPVQHPSLCRSGEPAGGQGPAPSQLLGTQQRACPSLTSLSWHVLSTLCARFCRVWARVSPWALRTLGLSRSLQGRPRYCGMLSSTLPPTQH